MSRLHITTIDQATGQAAELFTTIKSSVGKVPNAYATIGSHSPPILKQALEHNAALKQGALSDRELEAINLVVSEATGCDYCLAAHTLMAKMAGYSVEQTRQLRTGLYEDDVAIDALVRFAREVVTTTGTLPEASLEAIQAVGYTDRQVIEAISAISAILFTNMVNRVNDTTVDFPKIA
ncbi:carboxymuconolactone decarboxylase family protein [Microbulbifer hainanensis]|uniref:carboxymuconolactone decarboxylase family protein n=1 Tax=Microbulbifer hainanensis TaxID=2735675 RepID=UPI001867BE41|nr:carboxymuconolactone decarboxylase family protein [Microbulbifer hainanensis]